MKVLNYQKILGLYELSQEQKLLLQASVLQGKAAIDAWEKWKKSVDFENLDSASNSLLCQLYRNLSASDRKVEDFYLARLKGIYKRTWYGNQLLLKKLQTILQAFESAEIETIILDDIALLTNYYQDCGSRPLDRIDLLLHPIDGSKAVSLVRQLGWNQTANSQEIVTQENLWIQLQDELNNTVCLQGNIFHFTPFPSVWLGKQLWNDATPCKVGNFHTLMLNSNNLLLHLCSKIFKRGQNQQFNLLADAMTILQQKSTKIDWIELLAKAQSYQLILPLRNTLILLQQIFGLLIPPWVIGALYQMPISNRELLLYYILPLNKKTLFKSTLVRSLSFLNSNN